MNPPSMMTSVPVRYGTGSRQQKQNRIGDFLRFAVAAHGDRDLVAAPLVSGVVRVDELLRQVLQGRVDGPGTDAIDLDVVLRALGSGAFGQPEHRVFRCRVVGPVGGAFQRKKRTIVDHLPAAGSFHCRQDIFQAHESRPEVHRHAVIEFFHRRVDDALVGAADAGIVEQERHGAELGFGALDITADLRFVGHVGDMGDDPAGHALGRLLDGVESLAPAPDRKHRRAGFGELECRRLADAGAGSRHDPVSAFESEHAAHLPGQEACGDNDCGRAPRRRSR